MQAFIVQFLRSHHDGKSPLLLGLSGGPDSLCLFYLLIEARKSYPFPLHIVHIDHRWRKESEKEAGLLQELAKQFSLPFHLKTLEPTLQQTNLEAAGRAARLSFFAEVMRATGAQATLLAHQGDDQGETILKRLLEGSHFLHLGGIKARTTVEGVEIWRPLLGFSKKTLVDELERYQVLPFEDATNLDARFLRGKMRTHLIPLMAQSFGKEIVPSLCHFGEMMGELEDYFADHLAPLLASQQEGPLGIMGNFEENLPSSLLEVKLLFRLFCEKNHLFPPRKVVETAAHLLLQGGANHQVEWGKTTLIVDRKKAFLLNGQEVVFSLLPKEEEGTPFSDWQTVWQGKGEVMLPPGQLQKVPMHTPYSEHVTLGEWYNKHHIPTFFRSQVPVWMHEGRIACEFLTGRSFQELNRKQLSGTMRFYIDVRKIDNGRPK